MLFKSASQMTKVLRFDIHVSELLLDVPVCISCSTKYEQLAFIRTSRKARARVFENRDETDVA